MATAQTELPTPQTEQTELIESVNCLEFETSQLSRAYRLWRSYVEQGTAPDWMVAAIRISYDHLIKFCLDTISALALATGKADEIECYECNGETAPPLARDNAETVPRVRFTALVDPSPVLTPASRQNGTVGDLTTEQTELIEKLNCIEFETSQLNRAYQLWRSYVEHGMAPLWMVAAIRITYDALIKFCLDTISALALATSYADEIECDERGGEIAPLLVRALLAEDSTTALRLRHGRPLQCYEAETDPAVRFTALVDPSPVLTPVRHENQIVCELTILDDVPRAFSAGRPLPQLKASSCEISCISGQQSATAEPSPELLPITHPEPQPEPDWPAPEMLVAVSPPSTSDTIDAISENPAIQLVQLQDQPAAIPVAIPIPAMLVNWLQGSSTGMLLVAASVAILIVVGGALGIYLASAQRAAPRPAVLPVQNSASQAAAGALAVPTSDKAQFKFDPDPVVAPLGRSFVLKAVLSRGSDIASMAVQIDYDANLLQFKGVSEGGFLANAGQQVVLVQRYDPLTGVLRISAEKSPGNPGISGDGPVFALSFQARQRGMATVSIVPGAHDSQGRRIEMGGTQVSVRVD